MGETRRGTSALETQGDKGESSQPSTAHAYQVRNHLCPDRSYARFENPSQQSCWGNKKGEKRQQRSHPMTACQHLATGCLWGDKRGDQGEESCRDKMPGKGKLSSDRMRLGRQKGDKWEGDKKGDKWGDHLVTGCLKANRTPNSRHCSGNKGKERETKQNHLSQHPNSNGKQRGDKPEYFQPSIQKSQSKGRQSI